METSLDLDRLPYLYELADLTGRPAKRPEDVAALLSEVEQQPMEVLLLAWELANLPETAGSKPLRVIELMIACKDPDLVSALPVRVPGFSDIGDSLGAFA